MANAIYGPGGAPPTPEEIDQALAEVEIDVGVVTETPGVIVPEQPANDKWWAIAGSPIAIEPSDVRPGYQRLKQKPRTTTVVTSGKASGASGPANTGTLTSESGSEADEDDGDNPDTFYYCYTCKDTWELDEDGYLDLACPYCGAGPAEFTIVEMTNDGVAELYDDLPFFHQ